LLDDGLETGATLACVVLLVVLVLREDLGALALTVEEVAFLRGGIEVEEVEEGFKNVPPIATLIQSFASLRGENEALHRPNTIYGYIPTARPIM